MFVGDEDHSKFLRYTGYINFITDHVSHIFANTSSCPTTELSILLTSCPFTAIKSHFIKYCESVIKWNSYYLFWSIKNSGAILASSLSLYITLLHSLRCGPWARHIYPSLVLVQPRKTRPYIAERLLMGRKESNQTNKHYCMIF